jgi:hypothetical protein
MKQKFHHILEMIHLHGILIFLVFLLILKKLQRRQKFRKKDGINYQSNKEKLNVNIVNHVMKQGNFHQFVHQMMEFGMLNMFLLIVQSVLILILHQKNGKSDQRESEKFFANIENLVMTLASFQKLKEVLSFLQLLHKKSQQKPKKFQKIGQIKKKMNEKLNANIESHVMKVVNFPHCLLQLLKL